MLAFIVVVASGVAYFLFESGFGVSAVLLTLGTILRLNKKSRPLGRLLTMLFLFCGLYTLMSELTLGYPESLILILTAMIVVIFYEGPEWSKLYFGAGDVRNYTKPALLLAIGLSVLFSAGLYIERHNFSNPVPVGWPLDALVVVGIGFAAYVAIIEEIMFRSIFLQRAVAAGGETFGVVSQGVFYGMMFYVLPAPGGFAGLILGTIYGIILGFLVKKSNSIYLAIFVHFVVSLVVFIELAILGRMAGP